MEKCTLCDSRRARRNCPALNQIICPQCCGSKREETISCPLDCIYLMEGRAHEKLVQIAPGQLPNGDVRIEEEFIAQNQALLTFCGSNLYFACEEVIGVLDAEVQLSLEQLIAKYKTNLVYEPVFNNLKAAGVYRNFEKRADEFRVRLDDHGGNAEAVMDQYMFRLLVFLQRLAMVNNNGRARGRFFIQFLSGLTRSMSKPEAMVEGQ